MDRVFKVLAWACKLEGGRNRSTARAPTSPSMLIWVRIIFDFSGTYFVGCLIQLPTGQTLNPEPYTQPLSRAAVDVDAAWD